MGDYNTLHSPLFVLFVKFSFVTDPYPFSRKMVSNKASYFRALISKMVFLFLFFFLDTTRYEKR